VDGDKDWDSDWDSCSRMPDDAAAAVEVDRTGA